MWRAILCLLSVLIAACSGSPRDFGITGPVAPAPPVTPSLANEISPVAPDFGGPYAPSTGPGRFWGYN